MAVPKPSEARLIVRHYEDGRMRVMVDGKPIARVTGFQLSQDAGQRSVLTLDIIRLAFRVEQSPLRAPEDRDWQQAEGASDHPVEP